MEVQAKRKLEIAEEDIYKSQLRSIDEALKDQMIITQKVKEGCNSKKEIQEKLKRLADLQAEADALKASLKPSELFDQFAKYVFAPEDHIEQTPTSTLTSTPTSTPTPTPTPTRPRPSAPRSGARSNRPPTLSALAKAKDGLRPTVPRTPTEHPPTASIHSINAEQLQQGKASLNATASQSSAMDTDGAA